MSEQGPTGSCHGMRVLAAELLTDEAHRVHADALRHAADEIERLQDLAGDAIRALESIHCNNYDMPYCNEECPYSTGPNTCAVTELMERAEELGATFYEFDDEGREA